MAQEYEQLLAEFRKDNNIKPSKTSKTKNTLRTLLGQGIAFGFGDEIEAKARQLAGDGRSYDEIVSEIRGDIDRFRETNPTLAYGSEILGSLPSAIAGGAGFIGSNLAEFLIKEGHFVRVLDNFCSGKEENLEFAKDLGKDKFELIRGDIRDKDVMEQACEGIDYISLQHRHLLASCHISVHV